MYSLRLTCSPADVDYLSGELWEANTLGIREIENGGTVVLLAGFGNSEHRDTLLERFSRYAPEWIREDPVDWVHQTRESWPPRKIGERLFLAPSWSSEATPRGRERIVHNPGLACGTGEHPCSQLALLALEERVNDTATVVDVGTGSGMLAIAALRLGAASAIALDVDEAALNVAKENFELNGLPPRIIAGSAECLAARCADIVVANINATVLLSILDDLLRIATPDGCLILTGFPESEAGEFVRALPPAKIFARDEWRCVVFKTSDV